MLPHSFHPTQTRQLVFQTVTDLATPVDTSPSPPSSAATLVSPKLAPVPEDIPSTKLDFAAGVRSEARVSTLLSQIDSVPTLSQPGSSSDLRSESHRPHRSRLTSRASLDRYHQRDRAIKHLDHAYESNPPHQDTRSRETKHRYDAKRHCGEDHKDTDDHNYHPNGLEQHPRSNRDSYDPTQQLSKPSDHHVFYPSAPNAVTTMTLTPEQLSSLVEGAVSKALAQHTDR